MVWKKNIQCCDSSCKITHFILATRMSCWFVLHLENKLLMKISTACKRLFETVFKLRTNYFRLSNYMHYSEVQLHQCFAGCPLTFIAAPS